MARISVSKAAAIALVVLARCETAASQPSPSWTSRDRIALTYYFYWYDAHSNYHFINRDGSDGLTDHPTDAYRGDYSWAEIAWHQRELADISAAKIDAVSPVYWGSGHPAAGRAGFTLWLRPKGHASPGRPPEDRHVLRHHRLADHTRDPSRSHHRRRQGGLYSFIRTISRWCPRALATIDGKPIVVLYYELREHL
jgi:hypothetical protein